MLFGGNFRGEISLLVCVFFCQLFSNPFFFFFLLMMTTVNPNSFNIHTNWPLEGSTLLERGCSGVNSFT